MSVDRAASQAVNLPQWGRTKQTKKKKKEFHSLAKKKKKKCLGAAENRTLDLFLALLLHEPQHCIWIAALPLD